eukprot:TRINITY_DN1020_c0_g1_i12.p2 TRINITY_DN1020_c0_g1~~TRINITY_DN1020_c0_g1_i12.p2  ORF type:complete len:191 (-),score=24.06 TRINITY_DN1020_c0_g1_i12:1132-1704(-)
MSYLILILCFLNIYTMSQLAATRSQDELMLLQHTLNKARLECDKPSPDLWNIEESIKYFIQSSSESIFANGITLQPPNMLSSFAHTISENFKESFPQYNFDECLKIGDYIEGRNALVVMTVEPEEEGGYFIIHDSDLIDIDTEDVFFQNRPCFVEIMKAVLSSVESCVQKNVDHQITNYYKEQETIDYEQ